mmetsp:Transcript_177843/g.570388  ORF Transcript_177843/g.570388 Transcript_177843/m.570388 type:complete len:507 (+) Transcript_177843:4370-5890(+)
MLHTGATQLGTVQLRQLFIAVHPWLVHEGCAPIEGLTTTGLLVASVIIIAALHGAATLCALDRLAAFWAEPAVLRLPLLVRLELLVPGDGHANGILVLLRSLCVPLKVTVILRTTLADPIQPPVSEGTNSPAVHVLMEGLAALRAEGRVATIACHPASTLRVANHNILARRIRARHLPMHLRQSPPQQEVLELSQPGALTAGPANIVFKELVAALRMRATREGNGLDVLTHAAPAKPVLIFARHNEDVLVLDGVEADRALNVHLLRLRRGAHILRQIRCTARGGASERPQLIVHSVQRAQAQVGLQLLSILVGQEAPTLGAGGAEEEAHHGGQGRAGVLAAPSDGAAGASLSVGPDPPQGRPGRPGQRRRAQAREFGRRGRGPPPLEAGEARRRRWLLEERRFGQGRCGIRIVRLLDDFAGAPEVRQLALRVRADELARGGRDAGRGGLNREALEGRRKEAGGKAQLGELKQHLLSHDVAGLRRLVLVHSARHLGSVQVWRWRVSC